VSDTSIDGEPAGACSSHSGQDLRRARRQQQGRRAGIPQLFDGAQQVQRVDAHVGISRNEKLHARHAPRSVPQRTIAENQTAENRLNHGLCKRMPDLLSAMAPTRRRRDLS